MVGGYGRVGCERECGEEDLEVQRRGGEPKPG